MISAHSPSRALPLLAEDRHGPHELRLPALLDARERLQQLQPVGESGVVRVELAHRIEVQPEPPLPVLHMIVAARAVDDREPRLAGEPQDFHLGGVNIEHRLRAIHHVEDARAVHHGLEKHALGLEIRAALVPRDELAEQRQRLARLRRGRQLGERLDRVLKTRRVIENEQVAQLETLALDGLAGHRTDAHLVVLRERGDDGRLAVIDRAHDRECRRRLAHAGLHFSMLSGSRWIARKLRQCVISSSGTGAKSAPSFRPTSSRTTSVLRPRRLRELLQEKRDRPDRRAPRAHGYDHARPLRPATTERGERFRVSTRVLDLHREILRHAPAEDLADVVREPPGGHLRILGHEREALAAARRVRRGADRHASGISSMARAACAWTTGPVSLR